MKFRIMRFLIRLWVALIAQVEVHGMHKLPEGSVLVVSNHLGRLDTAVFFCVIDRQDIIMPIAGKYRYHPLYGLMGWAVDGIWLSRDGSDTALYDNLGPYEAGWAARWSGGKPFAHGGDAGGQVGSSLWRTERLPDPPWGFGTGTGWSENLRHFRRCTSWCR
jgi:hypothetical protein